MRLLAKPTAFGCHSYAASLRGVNHRAAHQYPLCRGTTQVPAVFSYARDSISGRSQRQASRT